MRVYPTEVPRLYRTIYFDIGQEIIDDQFFIIPKYLEEYAFRIDYGNYPQKTILDWAEAMQTKLWNSHNIKFELIYVKGTLNKLKNKISIQKQYDVMVDGLVNLTAEEDFASLCDEQGVIVGADKRCAAQELAKILQ